MYVTELYLKNMKCSYVKNIQGVPELNVHLLHVNSLRKIESKILMPKICQMHI